MIRSIHNTKQMTMRKLFLAAAVSSLFAMPAMAQVGSPSDGSSYVGPFGPAASGGVERFAQTFQRAAGMNWLQAFAFNLGDANPDGSGAGLVFQAAVYAVNGSQLGSQLFLSGLTNGSGNGSSFDIYSFATPNIFLDPSIDTFALVLQSVSTQNNGLNVIASGVTDYTGGALYTVDDLGALTAVSGSDDAAFDATLTSSSVPEPATFVLFASGLAFVGVIGMRRRQG
ncbi:MAG: PEP-CTERM sorting domain-containing protein [bacterium]